MAKRMLVDSTHPEETRVVVVDGNRLEEFDFESSTKKQLKGNIYLAKVTRVEPSLQACFVDYGGGRHGFLAFNEIHPDYYRLPVADRQRLISQKAAEIGEDLEGNARDVDSHHAPMHDDAHHHDHDHDDHGHSHDHDPEHAEHAQDAAADHAAPAGSSSEWPAAAPSDFDVAIPPFGGESGAPSSTEGEASRDTASEDAHLPQHAERHEPQQSTGGADEAVESLGGDEADEMRRRRGRPIRSYKIQEVIKRRQVLLVQVVKEERGTKGAALTTYMSLAGRYCVLMPNTGRGGGISRRITNAQDRKRLKSIIEDLDVPEGMAVILRTAGMERSKVEIKRDFEYLLRLWDEVRELTLRSTAPKLVYEEGSLIKRAIRDLYSRDIEEVLVEGDEGYRTAKTFMKTLMPSHASRVKLYRDTQPLFHRYQIENQLDEIHNPTIRLPAGGSIVIGQTEALVAIDVNSGRATRERHIEETATRTNLEAADEIARQLRLRDLAGLIVIDFIDMEDSRNQHAVERRLKEAMKSDRARIQIGRISPFGLLELSRQRLRPSLLEVSSERCPHCVGTGLIRSTESTALHVLRAIEEEGMKQRASEITVSVPTGVAMYVLNHKRAALAEIETRYHLHIVLSRDDTLIPPALLIERTKARTTPIIEDHHATVPQIGEGDGLMQPEIEAIEPDIADEPPEAVAEERPRGRAPQAADDRNGPRGEDGGRRRRRRRRGRGRDDDRAPTSLPSAESDEGAPQAAYADSGDEQPSLPGEPTEPHEGGAAGGPGDTDASGRRRRRRGRRGGRRRHREEGGTEARPQNEHANGGDEQPAAQGFAGEEHEFRAAPAEENGPADTPAVIESREPDFNQSPPSYRFTPDRDEAPARVEKESPRLEPRLDMTPPEQIHHEQIRHEQPDNGHSREMPEPPPPERPKQPARRGWWRRGSDA